MLNRRSWTILGACLCALLASAQPADAQNRHVAPAEPIKAPTPGRPDTPPTVMSILLAVVLVGLIFGAALIPSKRGHQD
ncbi:MAG TPA: hypothetical protein VD971_04895 [Phycisphaerales bacterium]|nr:hypothetical protein [Phycisphaerales bacterium]